MEAVASGKHVSLSRCDCKSGNHHTNFKRQASGSTSTMIVVLVAMFLNLMTVMALELGAPYRSLPISTNDVWTPTCIAGSPSEDASFIGGFRTLFKNDTSYLTIMKRSTVDEPPLWTRTIFSAYGRKNLALGCTTDSSGDVYVTTASNAPWFDGIKNTLFDTGAYSLFITKLDGNANGKTIWTRALNRTSAGFDDALEVAWDSLNNAIVIFGQMHVIGGQLVSGNQAQVIRLDAVCGNLISNDIIGSRDTTMARRLLVNDNGEAFFIGSASSFFNSWYPMCSPTPCMSCFISKYNSTGGHEWTVGASVRSDCLGVTVALDRVSTHLVVYADVRDSQVARSTMLRRINTITGARSNPVYYGSASTSIGAVFTHAGKILISGVTSEDFTNANQKRPCSTCTFSFFAQLNTSASTTTPFEIIDVQYWPRAVNTGITESRHSGMAWSTVTSKVTCLTTTTLDSLVDRSVLMVVNAPTYPSLSTIPKLPIYQQTCPMNIPVITSTAPTATTTRTTSAVKTTSIITLISSTRGMTYSQSTKTTSATATGTTSTLSGLVSTTPTQPSGLPNDGDLTLLDSPIFWAVFALIICSGILISIGIVLARRNNRQNYSEDKEQQFQLGTRTLSASTNALLQSNNDLSTKSFTDIQLVAFPRDQVKIQDRLNTVVLFSQPANAAQNIIQAAEPTSVLLSQHDLAPPVYISQKLVSKPPPAAFAVVTRGTRNGDASRRNVTNSNERLDMHSVNSSNKIGNNSTAKTETLAEEPIQKAGIHELSKGSSVRFNGFQAKPVPSARKIDLDATIISKQKPMAIPGFLEMQEKIDFTIGKELARGGGGSVHLGEAMNPEILRLAKVKQIVVKQIFEDKDDPEECVATFDQEVAVMWLLSGRNIAKIVGYCRKPMCILMKFYPCGALSDLIHEQSSKPTLARFVYNDQLALRLAADIACGVTEIHKEGLFHSDLKPPNVLLDVDDQGVLFAVITDFGVTQVVKQKSLLVKAFRLSTMAGASPCYASPELLDENAPAIEDPILQQASDTFSFAVILAELVTRTGPWESASSLEAVTKNVIAGQRAYSRPLNLGTQDYHRTVANLIERCWDQAPRARPEMRIAYHQLLDVLRGMPKV